MPHAVAVTIAAHSFESSFGAEIGQDSQRAQMSAVRGTS